MMSEDRESTQEWLVPGAEDATGQGADVIAARRGNGGADAEPPPPAATGEVTAGLDQSARRTEIALRGLDRRVGDLEAAAGLASEFASQLEQGLSRTNDAALEAASRAQASAELARSSAGRVEELALRAETALRTLEAREVAIKRRAEEAESEQQAMRSFSEHADRIVERLRALEQP